LIDVNLTEAKEFVACKERLADPVDRAGHFYLDESGQCECYAEISHPTEGIFFFRNYSWMNI